MQAILSTIEYAADSGMKVNEIRAQKPKIPAWNDEIEPFRENAYFWHAIWLSAGKPLNNQLHQIMKKTRNRYHLVIRKQKRLLERVKRSEMLNACLENSNSIFDAIKKKRQCKQTPASTIDGHSDDISGYLASKYENLYNAVDDQKNLNEIESHLENNIM